MLFISAAFSVQENTRLCLQHSSTETSVIVSYKIVFNLENDDLNARMTIRFYFTKE